MIPEAHLLNWMLDKGRQHNRNDKVEEQLIRDGRKKCPGGMMWTWSNVKNRFRLMIEILARIAL